MKESSITQWLEIEVIVWGLNWLGTVCLGGLNFLGSNWLGTKFVGDCLSRRTKLLGTECEGPNVQGPIAFGTKCVTAKCTHVFSRGSLLLEAFDVPLNLAINHH